MSEQPTTTCGHICCDEPNNPFHSHFLDPDSCAQCGRVEAEQEELEMRVRELRATIDEMEGGNE